MPRKMEYVVATKSLFSLEQWTYLDMSFWKHPNRDEYRVSPFGIGTVKRVYFISRHDHKPLVKLEIEGLYWFFHGVINSPGFPKD